MAKEPEKVEVVAEGEDVREEEGEDIEAAKELLAAIKENMKKNRGRRYKVQWWDSVQPYANGNQEISLWSRHLLAIKIKNQLDKGEEI